MDLVDIDQVLDNLELRIAADEQLQNLQKSTQTQAKLTATATATATATPAEPDHRPQGDGATASSSAPNGNGAAPKNFVGVSQVFNSLDDYRNNVKALETATQAHYNWAGDGELEEEDEDADHNKGDDDDNLDHEDINKFSESQPTKLQLAKSSEPIVSSSESLTTSSCSTFSSGPSPGNVSNSEEISTPPESEKPSALEILPKEDQENEEDENGQENALEEEEESMPPPPQRSSAVVEDLAVGLSSISITNTNSTESQSILPCEVTACSSVLGKVLNELSAETGDEPPKQEKEKAAEPLPLVQEIRPQPKRSQPLTFCSTMDEISDTELDSMLQEIDIDEATTGTAAQEVGEAAATGARLVPHQMINDDEGVSTSPVTEEESVRILSDQDTTSADQMNVDNFTQASTVEFADLRQQEATTSTPVTAMGEELASSFSSTESDSLSGRKLDDDDEEEVDDEAELEDEGLVEDHVEMENGLATDALETQEQRPERPKTLDLNSFNAPSAAATAEGEQVQAAADPAAAAAAAGAVNVPGEDDEESPIYEAVGYSDPHANLGKVPPIWVPDNMALGCMQCQQKFTMIKRRHHCRACGKVLCSICCSQRFKLEFANEPESRVCVQCFMILTDRAQNGPPTGNGDEEGRDQPPTTLPPTPMRSPNPNNPMEYCSTIPPHRQVATPGAPPPSVIVPVGVLKKTDSSSTSSNSSGKKTRKRESVMFSDGIAPGSELASTMEQQWGEAKQARRGHDRSQRNNQNNNKPPTPGTAEPPSRGITDSTTLGLVAQLFRGSIPPSAAAATLTATERSESPVRAHSSSPRRKAEVPPRSKKLPATGDAQGCFIPYEEHALPPICLPSREATNCDFEYKEVRNDGELVERLQQETLKFIVKNNFFVLVKIINLSCCMNRWVINFTTSGLHHVGNDEIIILLEIKLPKKGEPPLSEPAVPRDIFQHLYEIYTEAEHARSIVELAFSSPRNPNFLGSREYGGFIYIRPTYQCLQGMILPESPYLVGVLIHRHEVPWAKVLPLRLILRLGAQYRYYPCPLISVRNRESVYAEIAQTIINFLADFRNYSYTLPAIRGLYIHMEDRQTTVIIPRYRQNDIIKAINNASDHILAFAGNFSKVADGHLVCMQNVNDERSEMYSYSTQAINIQGQPRKVTGASFFVLNEALKSSSGLSGKCSIVEDGLMVQILPAKMEEVRNALRNQTDIDIVCGPIDASDEQSEIVSIKWVENDRDINVGVKSPIDDKPMDGVANMRVHATFNYSNSNYTIRLTDIFILKCDDWYATNGANYSDITRISEQLARSASMALLPYLDLLAAAGISKVGLRATLDQENVGYEAGARGSKLPPLYMNALDNHLVATLHTESSGIEEPILLELVFYILNV